MTIREHCTVKLKKNIFKNVHIKIYNVLIISFNLILSFILSHILHYITFNLIFLKT